MACYRNSFTTFFLYLGMRDEVVCTGLIWQSLNEWRAHVNVVRNLLVPKIAGKLLGGYTSGGLSSRAHLNAVSLMQVP
jgi:hypothetical protein